MAIRGSSTVGTARYFQERFKLVESGCVVWTSTLKDGYGMAVIGYRGHAKPIRRPAHVLMYELWRGQVPEGHVLDHLCRNRACVNPAHLEPVTPRENTVRGALPQLMRDPSWRPKRKRNTVCKNGHAMAGDNLGHSGGRRVCRACKRETSRRLRSKK